MELHFEWKFYFQKVENMRLLMFYLMADLTLWSFLLGPHPKSKGTRSLGWSSGPFSWREVGRNVNPQMTHKEQKSCLQIYSCKWLAALSTPVQREMSKRWNSQEHSSQFVPLNVLRNGLLRRIFEGKNWFATHTLVQIVPEDPQILPQGDHMLLDAWILLLSCGHYLR